jgi:hypothetical protein
MPVSGDKCEPTRNTAGGALPATLWYVRRRMKLVPPTRRWIALAGSAALVAGCGGGGSQRQDADEPKGTWKVDVLEAEFPRSQRLAEQSTLRIRVRNDEDRALPNVAVTVDSFSKRSDQPGLADATRPVWIIDDGPRGGTTAYTNTWALGRMSPGQTKTFEWRVTPVEAGTHRVSYRVAAGLDGKAIARLDSGNRPEGTFTVRISDKPSQSRVDPQTGDVIRE